MLTHRTSNDERREAEDMQASVGLQKKKGSERARVATAVDMTLAVDRKVDCRNL